MSTTPPPPPGQPLPLPSDDTPRPWWKRWWVIGLGIVVLFGLISEIGGGDEPVAEQAAATETSDPVEQETSEPEPDPTTDEPEPEPEPEPAQHDDSKLACQHFRNVMGDVGDGVLTDEEIRTKVREIDDNAIIATASIQTATRELLAAASTGTVDEFIAAAQKVSDGCNEAGW